MAQLAIHWAAAATARADARMRLGNISPSSTHTTGPHVAPKNTTKARTPAAALRAEADNVIGQINDAVDTGVRKFNIASRVADLVVIDLKAATWKVAPTGHDPEAGMIEITLTDPSAKDQTAEAAPAPTEPN